jgi:hypothetical protein
MSIAFVQRLFYNVGGTPPFTTGSVTPNSGDYLSFLNLTGDGTSANLQLTSSAGGTYTSRLTFNDLSNRSWALIDNPSCVGGAQTFTATETFTSFVGVGYAFEYSGVGSVSNYAHTDNNNPGLGAGAIVGASIVVPTGSVLVALCFEETSSETISNTAGNSRDSVVFNPSFRLADYAGAGSAIQPAFTTSANGTLEYQVWQFILNPPGGGGAPVAWLT